MLQSETNVEVRVFPWIVSALIYFLCRPKSAGEMYAYLPLTSGNACRLLAVSPLSKENGDYGFSVSRGSFCLNIAVGRWVSLALRVKLNDVGDENGAGSIHCIISWP